MVLTFIAIVDTVLEDQITKFSAILSRSCLMIFIIDFNYIPYYQQSSSSIHVSDFNYI